MSGKISPSFTPRFSTTMLTLYAHRTPEIIPGVKRLWLVFTIQETNERPIIYLVMIDTRLMPRPKTPPEFERFDELFKTVVSVPNKVVREDRRREAPERPEAETPHRTLTSLATASSRRGAVQDAPRRLRPCRAGAARSRLSSRSLATSPCVARLPWKSLPRMRMNFSACSGWAGHATSTRAGICRG